jgi:hypothetical protein
MVCSAGDDVQIQESLKALLGVFKCFAGEESMLHWYILAIYAHRDKHVFKSYGTRSAMKLKADSAVYDPEQVFWKCIPGSPKLSSGD